MRPAPTGSVGSDPSDPSLGLGRFPPPAHYHAGVDTVEGGTLSDLGPTVDDEGRARPGPPGSTAGSRPGSPSMSERIERLVDGRWTLAETVLVVLAAAAAWVIRFAQDDAFITYRYSRNLARGEGLVFNTGERVEGYTNFLWTALHAVPERLGWSTPLFSQVVGIATMVGAVLLTGVLARRLFDSRGLALLAQAALVANVTFLGYGTGGLETMLQTLLVLGVTVALLPFGTGRSVDHGWPVRRLVAGVLGGLAVLTRMDSAVLVTTVVLVHLVAVWRSDRGVAPAPAGAGERGPAARRALAAACWIGLPAVAVMLPWLVWKWGYYGSLLPNTFTAKSSANPVVPFVYGVVYLLCFFLSYAAFLLVGRARRLGRSFLAIPGVAQVWWVVPVWFLYVCVVGADFMEFRFVVPVIPLLALLAAYLVDPVTSVLRQVLLVGTLLVFSAAHAVAPTILPYPVLTFTQISHWPSDSPTAWQAMGELLHEQFPGGPDVPGQPVIAVAPLGVIGYFADLPTIDMLGLADATVAREGATFDLYYPGHVRMATVPYLEQRGVDLVIGQPRVVPADPERTSYRLSEVTNLWPAADLNLLPEQARIIEVPVTDDQVWLLVWLEPNDRVAEAVQRNGWRVLPIERVCDPSDQPNWFARAAVGDATCG
jgi:arabinofuranosyltransferase